MLLSLHKRVCVVLCPDQIAIRSRARGWRRGWSAPQVLLANSTSTPAWQSALQLLQNELIRPHYTGARVQVIVSDRLLQYALIPWSNQLSNPAEQATLMQIHFDSLFGSAPGGREIVFDLAQFGAAGLACAIERNLLSAVRQALSQADCTLDAMQPYFMRIANRWRQRLSADFAGDAMLVLAEAQHALLACRKQGQWHALRSISFADASQLPALISRERLLQGLPESARVYLHSPLPLSQPGLKTLSTLLEAPPAATPPALAAGMMWNGAS